MRQLIKISVLERPTKFLFFTGEGGVGKRSLSTAEPSHLLILVKEFY